MKRAFLITLLFAVTGAAFGQGEAPYGAPQNGGPSQGGDPGVAHLSMIHGDVSMQRGDSGDWVATSLNTPIVRGDVVATGDGSRAEIQLDFADIVRLSGQSQAKIADLSRNHIQVQVSQGSVNLSMFQGGQAEVEIDTPNVSVHPRANGRYLVEVNADAETNVVVRSGEAEIATAQGSTTIHEGDLITIRGTDDPEYKVAAAPVNDDWDRWNSERDNLIRNADGLRHTNAYYAGAQDLDAYGHWTNVPGYGEVWAPTNESAAWAPYQAGRWTWEPYYGWTWVSFEPWGWAPYHYGRWFVYGGGWYWWPGPVTPVYEPIWSPAFVGFVGFGPRVGFGFGFGSIAWFPLAPFEVFHPWWGVGFNRFGVVGFERPFGLAVHSNFGVAFTDVRVRAGFTTVAAENFGRGPAGYGHGIDVASLHEAHLANGNLGITPSRESLSPTNRGFRSAPAGMRNVAGTHFAGRAAGAVPSFHDETSRMQESARARGGEMQAGSRGQSGSSFGRSGGFGNESRNDRPANAGTGRTFGNDRPGSTNSAAGNRDGYRSFSGSSANSNASASRGGTYSRGAQPGYAGSRSGSYGAGGGSRPQLDMGRRIATPRTSSGAGNSGAGSYGGRSGGSSGGYYGGSRPSGGNYGGGGHSSGSGGGHGGGGGGHSGGGHR